MSALVKAVEFDDSMMWVNLTDGRRLGVPLAFFPRLLRAKPAQRSNLIISGGGLGLHWDAFDEDIHVGNLLAGVGDRSKSSELAA